MLSTCSDLTPEQVRARASEAPRFALVDLFGVVHLLPSSARIGRDPDVSDLAILHASISSHHAQVGISGDTITILDQGSLNGTFVGGERVSERTLAAEQDTLIRFGAVSFLLCPDALGWSGPAPAGRRTVPRGDRGSRLAVVVRGVRWELSMMDESGALAGEGREIALSRMEGRLLGALLARAGEDRFLPTGELVCELGFGPRTADGENVRELVRRLRRKLDPLGLGDLIESRRQAGYRIARHVTVP
jgi:hypothetical protein